VRFAIAAVASAVVLAACGGGGGGDAGDGGAQNPPPVASVDVSGVAAKGLLSGGIVTAHAINSDGSIRAEALATAAAPTDANGRYTLSFPGPTAQPYVIKVTVPAGGATHRDEVTGQAQSLPPGFAMRALVVPAATAITANVTPFSEMATEAAEDAGISAASAQQANHTIKTMLGITASGDLATVPVKSASEAASADEQRLALMLTAVSQMAASGAAGCTGDAGARAQCVVQVLSDAVTAPGSFALSGDAAPALSNALEVVLQTPSLVGNVPASVLAPALAALECEGVACNAPAPSPALDTAGAIAATKALFTELKSDLVSLFGDPDAVERGAIEIENNKFGAAMIAVQAPAEMLVKDTGAVLLGIDLYNDYKAGRTPVPVRGRAVGEFASDFGLTSSITAVGCTLFQDATTNVQATSPANANFIGCSARYYFEFATNTQFAHGFTITPGATPGEWTYRATAQRRQALNPRVVLAPAAGPATGTLSTTLNGSGQIIAFSASGSVPGAFRQGTTELGSDSNQWNISGTRTIDPSNPKLSTTRMSGTVVAKDSAGATLGTLQVRSASASEIPVSRDAAFNIVAPHNPAAVASAGGELAAASLDVLWTVPNAEFEGTFSATDSVWDGSGVSHIPTRVTLEGRLSNIEAGVKTDFFQGKLTLLAAGYDQHSAASAVSASNFYTVNGALSATLTAPGRPLLAMRLGTSWKAFEDAPKTATLEYRSFNGGTARMGISVEASVGADGLATVSIAESGTGVSVTARQDATAADVMLRGTTRIGSLDATTGVLTFTDGSFVSAGF
jgi:hypothetical protein